MIMVSKVLWKGGMKHRPLYSSILCVSTVLGVLLVDPAGRAHATDTTTATPSTSTAESPSGLDATSKSDHAPLVRDSSARSGDLTPARTGGGDEQQSHRYEDSLSKEAALASPSGVSADPVTGGSPPEGREAAADSAKSSQSRLDEIKAAVSEALIGTQAQKAEGSTGAEAESQPEESSIDERRQWLRKVVGSTPVPDNARDAEYVGELRKEVPETLVMGEAVPKDEAVALSRETTDRPADAMKTEEMQPGIYQVRPGDSLWKIAKAHFGDGYQWQAIYDANRDTLRNTNVLSIGQMLRIPHR